MHRQDRLGLDWCGAVNGTVIGDDGILGELDPVMDLTHLVPKSILDQMIVTSELEGVDRALHVVFIFEGGAVSPSSGALSWSSDESTIASSACSP